MNELRFGRATERLARLLDEPDAPRPGRPGRGVRAAQGEVEAAPGDWRAWYRLAVAYGDARDTARGRRTMRKAIALQRAESLGPRRLIRCARPDVRAD